MTFRRNGCIEEGGARNGKRVDPDQCRLERIAGLCFGGGLGGRCLALFYPRSEFAAAPRRKFVLGFPGTQRRNGDELGRKIIERPATDERSFPDGRLGRENGPAAKGRCTGRRNLFLLAAIAEAKKKIWNGNVDGAHFIARTAEA